MAELDPIPPTKVADQHQEPDPTGYRITHEDAPGGVLLVLTRLADEHVIGKFADRDALDVAVEADRV